MISALPCVPPLHQESRRNCSGNHDRLSRACRSSLTAQLARPALRGSTGARHHLYPAADRAPLLPPSASTITLLVRARNCLYRVDVETLPSHLGRLAVLRKQLLEALSFTVQPGQSPDRDKRWIPPTCAAHGLWPRGLCRLRRIALLHFDSFLVLAGFDHIIERALHLCRGL